MRKLLITFLLLVALPASAQLAQNQILPATFFGDGVVISTSTSGTAKLGAVATSSLGLPTFNTLLGYLSLPAWYATTTDALDEGTNNLYFTDTRVANYISGSTTIAKATPVNGNVLLGNGTVWTSVATSSLGITGSGTVSSVAMSVPTGFTVSGSPITTSGTLGLSFDTGYALNLIASSTNWNNFYLTPSTRITDGSGLTWSTNTLNCDIADTSTFGCLTSTDWNTFNDKVSTTTLLGYVPYTGAVNDLDLGVYGLRQTNGGSFTNIANDGTALKLSGLSTSDVNTIGFSSQLSNLSALFNLSSLSGSDKSFIFPNEDGTFALGTGSAGNCAQWSTTNTLTDTGSPCATGGITSLNGQTGATQTFATSSIAGGFGFSSAVDVHTLNIPYSSSSVSGLLSNTDWTSFNTRVSTSGVNTIISASTTVAKGTPTNGNIFVGNGTNWVSQATSTLGLITTDITEGTKLFYTDARVNTAISASTTVAHATPTNGNVLLGNGTVWTSVATSSLGFGTPHAPVTLTGENYLSLSGQQITANAVNLSGTNVTGVLPSANVSTSTLNINHSNLKGLAWTDSAHTGTAFNLAGFTSAGSATNYATSTLKINHSDLAALAWSGSGHTGTAFNLAGFTSAGVATNYATSSLKITIGDVTGLGTGVVTFLQTPTSANLATAVTDETGSGALVFGTQPVFSGDITTPRVNGSSAASGSLALTSTSDSSKGLIYFGTALSPVAIFDELNGRLALAVTTNTAKLYVKGSTGSGAIVDVASSTGTSVFKIANNGDITLNSDNSSRIGIGVAPDPDVGIYVSRSVSNNNAGARGIQFYPVLETTASGNSTIAIGGQFRPAAAVAQGTGFGSLLQYGAAQVQNTSSWGITTLNGNTIRVDELSGYSGAVTTLNILNMTAGLKGGTGTIGTVNVINIPAGHTVYNATNLRGIKSALAASSTAPTSTYNLYVDGTAPNYFAGYLGLGESAPASALEIQDTGTTTIQVMSSTASRGGRIILEDSDGAGCTELTTLNGVPTYKIVTCL